MRLISRVISPRAGETGSPKAIYSFNGLLMRFVLHLPVSSDVPLDSDEAELFIWGSCSRRRHAAVHLQAAAPSSLMWSFFSLVRKVRDFFLWCRLITRGCTQGLLSVSGCGDASHLFYWTCPVRSIPAEASSHFYVSSLVSRIRDTILSVMSQGTQILSQYQR